MAAKTTHGSINSTRGSGPLLCERCHIWNDVSLISSWRQLDEVYEEHAVDIALDATTDTPDCLICKAVYTAATTRLNWERSEGRNLGVGGLLVARNFGPVFLDNEFSREPRVDYSWRLPETRMRMIIYIKIYTLNEQNLVLELAPRFCLRHTKSSSTRLVGIEPWETPFFDISLIKSWIRKCDSFHTLLARHPGHRAGDSSSESSNSSGCRFCTMPC